MATSGSTRSDNYSIRALYEVIKLNLLMKDKDLVHFMRTMNDNIVDDFNKVKNNPNLSIHEITNRYENYAIIFMMIRSILRDSNITGYNEKTREITNFFLTDELTKKGDNPPQKSVYDDED